MHINEKGFEIHKHRDNLKQGYCIENNIPLHIIKYDENLKDKMETIINI